jgi:putative sigma-54 modulation protein
MLVRALSFLHLLTTEEMKMQIAIQSKGFELTPALRAHAERRLQFALHWAGRDLRSVNMRLSDINGPRGGNDKRCTIQLVLGEQSLVIEDTEADLYVAIDRAVDRSKRNLTRRLERLREHKHERHTQTLM